MKEKNEYQIFVPKQFVRTDLEMDSELKRGILIAFCFIRRFSTADGIFSGRLLDIMDDLGLHFDKTKTSRFPKKITVFLKGLDYLINSDYIVVLKGNYHSLEERFLLQMNNINYNKGYVLLKYTDFDYILKIKKRIDKAGLLETLLFVSSCYNYIDYGLEKSTFTVCSYPLDTMAKIINIGRCSLYNYLTNLSVEQGYEGNAPLIKSKMWHMVIGERIIRFPSIFVKNEEGAIDKIEFQKKYLRKKLETNKIENMDDLNELFKNPHVDDEIDELY